MGLVVERAASAICDCGFFLRDLEEMVARGRWKVAEELGQPHSDRFARRIPYDTFSVSRMGRWYISRASDHNRIVQDVLQGRRPEILRDGGTLETQWDGPHLVSIVLKPLARIPGSNSSIRLTEVCLEIDKDGFIVPYPKDKELTVGEDGKIKGPIHSRWHHRTNTHYSHHLDPFLDGLYQRIVYPYLDLEETIDAAAELHWWLSHNLMNERGGAGKNDAIIKALLMARGIFPGRWRNGISPDIKAFGMSCERFVREYRSWHE